jgi:WXG100 family type VII secretion target
MWKLGPASMLDPHTGGNEMGDLSFDATGAKKGAGGIEEVVAQLKSTINGITQSSQAVKGGWGGPAHDRFVAAADNWSEEGTALNKRLDDIVQTLHDGYSKYTQAEQANAVTFKPH